MDNVDIIVETLLNEGQYSLPPTGKTAMFDFYALYSLWWSEGSGQESYGYDPQNITNHSRRVLINRTMEESAFDLSKILIEDARGTIADEFTNIYDENLVDHYDVVNWVKNTGQAKHFANIARLGEDSTAEEIWNIFGYDDLMLIFNADFWRGEKSDLYGGPPWSKIVMAIKNLDKKRNSGSLPILLKAIDELYDLEHNTGSLMVKMPPRTYVSQVDLDYRAQMRSSYQFKEFVSPMVKKLIRDTDEDPFEFVEPDFINEPEREDSEYEPKTGGSAELAKRSHVAGYENPAEWNSARRQENIED